MPSPWLIVTLSRINGLFFMITALFKPNLSLLGFKIMRFLSAMMAFDGSIEAEKLVYYDRDN